MNPEDISAVAALVFDALEGLAGESSPAAVAANGRLHAAARILRRADRRGRRGDAPRDGPVRFATARSTTRTCPF